MNKIELKKRNGIRFTKKLLSFIIIVILCIPIVSYARGKGYGGYRAHTYKSYGGSVRVRGYTHRSTGTYVMSHRRTSPDSTKFNNWSTKGNVNPYTGKKGSH